MFLFFFPYLLASLISVFPKSSFSTSTLWKHHNPCLYPWVLHSTSTHLTWEPIIRTLVRQHQLQRQTSVTSSHFRGSKALCRGHDRDISHACSSQREMVERECKGNGYLGALEIGASKWWIDLSLQRWKKRKQSDWVWSKDPITRRAGTGVGPQPACLQASRKHTQVQAYRNSPGEATLESKGIRGLNRSMSWVTG